MSIVIFGDSISRGAFDLEKGGWANRLKIFLWQENYKQTGIYYKPNDLDCFAVDGDIVIDIVNCFDSSIQTIEKWGIQKIIFAIGINDAGFERGKKLSNKKDFRNNLKILAEKGIEKVGKENVYFLGITDVNFDTVNADNEYFKKGRIEQFDDIIQNVVSEYDCNFIVMQKLLNNEDLGDDGLHPNSDGHEKIFQKVKISLGY